MAASENEVEETSSHLSQHWDAALSPGKQREERNVKSFIAMLELEEGSCCNLNLKRYGFTDADPAWRSLHPVPVWQIVRMLVSFKLITVPAGFMYGLLGLLAVTGWMRDVGKQPFNSWQEHIKWLHTIIESCKDLCLNFFVPWVLHITFRTESAKRGLGLPISAVLALLAPAYLISMHILGWYSPLDWRVHAPLNIHWGLLSLGNIIAFAVRASDTCRQALYEGCLVGLAICLPFITYLGILYFLYPTYKEAWNRPLQQGIIGGVCVPAAFVATQAFIRFACRTLAREGRHPGDMSHLATFAIIEEACTRRTFIAGIRDWKIIVLSSIQMSVLDCVTQVTSDARTSTLALCTGRVPSEKVFGNPVRRRIRADMLLHRALLDQTCIWGFGIFVIVVRVFSLAQPLALVLAESGASLLIQSFVRTFCDGFTFFVEARCGLISRKLFKLERWDGIPLREVWLLRWWDFSTITIGMTLFSALYQMIYTKKVFEDAFSHGLS